MTARATIAATSLGVSVPLWAAFLGLVAATAAWVAMHRYRRPIARRFAGVLPVVTAGRVATGCLTLLAAARAMEGFLTLSTNWPIWPVALSAAASVELLLWFYRLERRTVSRKAGLALASLRVALLLIVFGVLTQPVRTFALEEKEQRYVAVLLDESASMWVRDTELSPGEKLRLARLAGVDVREASRQLNRFTASLREVTESAAGVIERIEDMEQLSRGDRSEAMAEAVGPLIDSIEDTEEALKEQVTWLEENAPKAEALGKEAGEAIKDMQARLKSQALGQVRDGLTQVRQAEGDGQRASRRLRNLSRCKDSLRRASSAVFEVLRQAGQATDRIDEAAFAGLSEADRRRVDEVVHRTRRQLARQVLFHPSGEDESLRQALAERYVLRTIAFASEPWELDAGGDQASDEAEPTTQPTNLDEKYQGTDIARALRYVLETVPAGQLSGVLLLSEGRHNHMGGDLQPVMRKYLQAEAPICSIAFGAKTPPRDAAIISVDAPESVFIEDKLRVRAALKFSGLAGRQVRVALYRDEESVDVAMVTIPDEAEIFRTDVEFSHEPKDQGLHTYRVEIEDQGEEVFAENNTQPMTVRVTDDAIKLLVIESRPRYEFRFLKNLFADRDKSVRLQYVLTQPDRIQGRKDRRKVHASAAAKEGRVEATALPENEQEWMKFDVVVLGDVDPGDLNEETMEILETFVTRRGGTLVTIAGQYHMPHAYADTPLEDLLPAEFRNLEALREQQARQGRPGSQKLQIASPEPVFRIELTTEGKESAVMSQSVRPEENQRVWDSIPEIYWRYPIVRAKPGATVLAYALPGKLEGHQAVFREKPWVDPKKPMDDDDPRKAEKILARRQKFENEHALILQQDVGLGRSLMLAFDRTYRMRSWEGDTYHHRFWGQVLRWATADKLAAGTPHVKVGTDRSRYQPHQPIRLRAKLVDEQFAPIESDEVYAVVRGTGDLQRRVKLSYVPDSAGMYQAELEQLPGGSYTVELEAPPARELLAKRGVKEVSSEFSVDQVIPAEQVELSPDIDLLGRLASQTGGVVLDPDEASKALDVFGPPTREFDVEKSIVLWDSWPVLLLILALATAEWITRKKVGLP